MRLRLDRYFSNVPYKRMVEALGQVTNVPQKKSKGEVSNLKDEAQRHPSVDNFIRQTILSSFAYSNEESPIYGDFEASKLQTLVSDESFRWFALHVLEQ